MNYISGNDRNQMQFFALEEMVAGDAWVRAIDQKNKLFVHADIGAISGKRELASMALGVKHLLDLKEFNTLR